MYDENGSLVSEKEGERTASYQYDLLNRQTNVKTFDGKEQENFYDGEGLRAGIKEDGKASTFLYLNGEILAECNGDRMPVRRHLSGLGLSHVQTLNDGIYHAYHQDEQGSTAYVTGSDGTVENCYLYDAFGNVTESQENMANRIMYTGQQYDQETGQYYLRARYYSPVIGRFTQEDTYRGDGLNLYAYCGNNPVMYYDPSGHNGTCSSSDQKEGEQQKVAGDKEKDFDSKWENYLKDIEEQTGRKIPENQRNELLEELSKNQHNEKLTGADYQQHRKDFNSSKEQMIKDWEENTGQKWPTYSEDVVSKNGNTYIPKGSNYDAHEIIPNVYDSPLEWWNIHPASNPKEHQGGIHRAGALIKEIFG